MLDSQKTSVQSRIAASSRPNECSKVRPRLSTQIDAMRWTLRPGLLTSAEAPGPSAFPHRVLCRSVGGRRRPLRRVTVRRRRLDTVLDTAYVDDISTRPDDDLRSMKVE